eukprot:TRINITY_DN5189_c0_g2_i1.p1 TRINITY_DN5189_c0_g2~~TRINITY_DN5189_c0_g2_i1.p1  ORF type:complete len:322 (+),score=92.67 TRINITY_DN5189_c0_g2_i1:77-967(+)
MCIRDRWYQRRVHGETEQKEEVIKTLGRNFSSYLLRTMLASRILRRTNFATRAFSSVKPAVLPDMPYDYGALEPAISAQIMEIHHKKHHQAYVTNFNNAMEQLLDAQAKGDASKIACLTPALKFNGGGHVNHSIFWTNLAPVNRGGGQLPEKSSKLHQAVTQQFGSFDNLIATFSKRATAIQGSGWEWLGFNPQTKALELVDMPNQDPLSLTGLVPLLGVDVWEHAYYLQYKNVRPDYMKEIWKVVNWKDVEARYLKATQQLNGEGGMPPQLLLREDCTLTQIYHLLLCDRHLLAL